ncbi:bacitracin ABC transporter ATP-binding protein [Staphylococcus schleiferi]|uniref:Putative hemin import ATP-binding protein HrtA n=1 Tax=Staphylococcus coagulans TaxID=74706 RepID=A0A9X1DXI1_9STAP|nr:ABC transporter ATP-binding protein [Staphylococcus coagulans]AKS67765.1 bacitracin ABC transporter ATP-binding protein [Staphylococcus schleiferi]NHB70745.1 ABC transporter ATP-binding protein [Staphylococcus sp. 191]AKS69935.1 bacitracin ABC transporter ATP-binding protein [Staphylococcus schleiferi]AKS72054.1 bacitracin ABC transporter ATP-binding protein [Staphylococcus schleiferi]AKS74341.1 bacitracin ABC transporter ATP-binding protein [Staphylococcus schleiferi]
MSILNVSHVSKIYGNKKQSFEVLKDINFKVEEGAFVAIMGPSGSGKTTLLNVLSSIDYVSRGTIEVNKQDITRMSNKQLSHFRKQNVGFIFQDYNVLDTLTVRENIMLPLSIGKINKTEAEQRYQEVTDALGITDLSHKYPNEISGGQKQRTAAARALISKPAIIFADEPTGALDSKSAQDLLKRLDMINRHMKTTIVMVTHDPVAASYAHRVIMLKDGQIHTELYQGDKPASHFYQEIIQNQSVLGGVQHAF